MSKISIETNCEYYHLFSKHLYLDKDFMLRWKESRGGKVKNSLAGTINHDGYTRIKLCGNYYMAHRIIWTLVYGNWPKDSIDHIDGNPSNNIPSNLRVVNHKTNCKNRKLYKNNNTGYVGISKSGDRYRARIHVDGKEKSLGYFDSIEEAIKSREQANKKYNYHQNHGNR